MILLMKPDAPQHKFNMCQKMSINKLASQSVLTTFYFFDKYYIAFY